MRYLLLLFGISYVSVAQAQYPYMDGTTETADEITFYVERIVPNCIQLKNVCNTLSDRQPENLQGEPVIPWEIEMGELDVEAFKRAFEESFTEDEQILMKERGSKIRLFLTKDSNGSLLEVSFLIYALPGMPIFPPSKFAQYEKNLKKYVRWKNITEDEKKLKFIHESMLLNLRALAPDAVFKGGEPIGAEELE